VKVAVHNTDLKRELQRIVPGEWKKVYRRGLDGTEIHYFEHASGRVALVKHKRE
jgi:hypothetical protein